MNLRSTVVGLGILALTVGLTCFRGFQASAFSNYNFHTLRGVVTSSGESQVMGVRGFSGTQQNAQ